MYILKKRCVDIQCILFIMGKTTRESATHTREVRALLPKKCWDFLKVGHLTRTDNPLQLDLVDYSVKSSRVAVAMKIISEIDGDVVPHIYAPGVKTTVAGIDTTYGFLNLLLAVASLKESALLMMKPNWRHITARTTSTQKSSEEERQRGRRTIRHCALLAFFAHELKKFVVIVQPSAKLFREAPMRQTLQLLNAQRTWLRVRNWRNTAEVVADKGIIAYATLPWVTDLSLLQRNGLLSQLKPPEGGIRDMPWRLAAVLASMARVAIQHNCWDEFQSTTEEVHYEEIEAFVVEIQGVMFSETDTDSDSSDDGTTL